MCMYFTNNYNSQDIETTKMSIDRYMDKEDMVCMYVYVCMCVCVYIYNGIVLSHEKK